MSPPDFDEKWALPFEVITVIAEWAMARHKRDFAGRHTSPYPYPILPLLLLIPPLTPLLLPNLYSSPTLHTHSQLLSFLRLPPTAIDHIHRLTLQVEYVQAPMLGCIRHAKPTEEEREEMRLHEVAKREEDEVRVGVEKLRIRLREAGRTGVVGGEGEGEGEERRVLVVKKTSAASLMIADCLKFPTLELNNYHHPPSLFFGHQVRIMEQSLLPTVNLIRLRCPFPALSLQLYYLREGIHKLKPPRNRELVIDVECYLPEGQPGNSEYGSVQRQLESLIKVTEHVRVKIAVLEEEGGGVGHLFCQGGMFEEELWEGGEEQSGRVTFVRCAEGSCPAVGGGKNRRG